MSSMRRVLVGLGAAVLLLAACGDDDATSVASDDGNGGGDLPTVVVTTTTLGDVVGNLSGGQFEVVTIMPLGADPHDFQASAQQANQIREADALIVNGGGLEEGLVDVIESAEGDGVPTFEALSAVETIEFGERGHDEHAEDDDHADEDDHGHEGTDPHFFQDPVRTAAAVEGIGDFLADTVEGIDADALEDAVTEYVSEVEALDAEVEELLAGIGDDQRVLVTNHDAFGYFADRYDFEIVGTVVPSGSTTDGASAGELAELADVVRDEGVPAIFAETTTSDELAQTLAAEVGGDVAVVELFTDSLGQAGSGAESYLDMIRTNAERIADALA